MKLLWTYFRIIMKWNKDFWMSFKGLFATLLLCVVAFVAGYAATWLFASPNEAGDTAGLINGFFSALAFAGVIYAIFLQRHELELQRKELADTRAEFQTQNETLKRQRFENTFFNMLQLQQQITDNISFSYQEELEGVKTIQGRQVFFKAFMMVEHESSTGGFYQGMRDLLEAKGFKEYEESMSPTYFDHYFRHLYRIFKFIADSPLISDEKDKYDYACMVRGQLSRYELIWLYYNGLSSNGSEKFKLLIERFALLKNLRQDMLAQNVELPLSYAPGAFRHLPWQS